MELRQIPQPEHEPLFKANAENAANFELEDLEKEKARTIVLKALDKYGVISHESGQSIFDSEKLKDWSSRNEINAGHRKLGHLEIIKALSSITGKTKIGTEQAVTVLPKSLEELLGAEKNKYTEKSKTAMLQPWEFGQRQLAWIKPLELESGEQTSLAEIAIGYTLSDWQAERGNDGRLTVIHPVSGRRVPFSASMFSEFAGIKPQTSEDKKLLSFDGNPIKFATKYLPHMLESGILSKEDFRVVAGTETAKQFNVHERNLKPGVPNVGFTNSSGQFANYYIGRDKIVGTGIKLDHEHMKAIQLDQETIAIIEEKDGKKTIVTTFALLAKEELAAIQETAKANLLKSGKKAESTKISQNTFVGAKQMKEKMREYSITDFLPARPGETSADYYKRLRPLDNAEFVTEQVQDFFSKAGIGLHNLPWAEQLVLSRALLEGTDQTRLSNFAKQYGLTGVRSFLSLDYDASLGNAILNLGEQLPAEMAKKVFLKFSEIVDLANQAGADMQAQNDLSGRDQHLRIQYLRIAKIKEQLLKKGKDLLVQMNSKVAAQSIEYLELVKTDILLFAATYKNIPSGERMNFSELENIAIENKDSTMLTAEEGKQMADIFEANRGGVYPQKLYDSTIEGFKEILNSPNHNFRMLKHEGKVVAFFHYDNIDPQNVYVGSFNLHPSAKDSPIAVAMTRSFLEENAAKNIQAVSWINNPANDFYLRYLGFKKVGEIPNYKESGETYLELERPSSLSVESTRAA